MYAEAAAFAHFTLHRQFPAHSFRNAFDNGKSQAAAVNLGGRDTRTTVERIENFLQILGADPKALVFDGDDNFLAEGRIWDKVRADPDPLIFSTVLYGIDDQVLQALSEGLEVHPDLREIGFNSFLNTDPRRTNQTGGTG